MQVVMAVRMVATAATVVAMEEVTAVAGMAVVTAAEMAMVEVMVGTTADMVGTEAVAMAATDTTDMAVVVVVATAVAKLVYHYSHPVRYVLGQVYFSHTKFTATLLYLPLGIVLVFVTIQ